MTRDAKWWRQAVGIVQLVPPQQFVLELGQRAGHHIEVHNLPCTDHVLGTVAKQAECKWPWQRGIDDALVRHNIKERHQGRPHMEGMEKLSILDMGSFEPASKDAMSRSCMCLAFLFFASAFPAFVSWLPAFLLSFPLFASHMYGPVPRAPVHVRRIVDPFPVTITGKKFVALSTAR